MASAQVPSFANIDKILRAVDVRAVARRLTRQDIMSSLQARDPRVCEELVDS
jgi:hypothetical protein